MIHIQINDMLHDFDAFVSGAKKDPTICTIHTNGKSELNMIYPGKTIDVIDRMQHHCEEYQRELNITEKNVISLLKDRLEQNAELMQ